MPCECFKKYIYIFFRKGCVDMKHIFVNRILPMYEQNHNCFQASAVASDCRRFVEQEQYCSSPDEERWTHLHAYLQRLDEFSPEHFQDVRAQACSSSRALQVWDSAWIHCQDVRRQLEERLALLEGAQTAAGHHSDWPEVIPGQDSREPVQDRAGSLDMED